MLTRPIDDFLNNLTMYRLAAYGLSLIALVSLLFGFAGTLSLPGTSLLASLALLLASCYAANRVLAYAWRVPANNESWFITALILFFILPPATAASGGLVAILAGVIAIASKFIIAPRRSHIFNPAAFAAVILGLTGLSHATWWVGSSVLWPFTLVLGLLVARKIRRMQLCLTFVAVSLLLATALALTRHQAVTDALRLAFVSSPLLFLGGIMLTEPATMPQRHQQQLAFAALVAALYALHPGAGLFYIYPETALLIGNLFAWIVSPGQRLRLRLKHIEKISDQVYDYAFVPDRALAFTAGQYLEWTLPHKRQDDRGNRRTFTIASSPTEDEIHLGVKFYPRSSSFKKALRAMKPGDSLYAGQLSGDFVLPDDPSEKLAFVAGGIGITPFRSMLQYLADSGQQRDIVLVYAVSDPHEIAYQDIFRRAARHGLRLVKVASAEAERQDWDGHQGPIDRAFIAKHIPDFAGRSFYVSGPNAMVENLTVTLRDMDVRRSRIRSDFFSGY